MKQVALVLNLFLWINICIVSNVPEICAFPQAVVAAEKKKEIPIIDGVIDDIWNSINEVIVRDVARGVVPNIDVTLKALYNNTHIFFLVRFPDKDESRLHKPWVWNQAAGTYNAGRLREDTFVFKWSMSGLDAELSLKKGQPHSADIWFWKANRTDPAGFADDKSHMLGKDKCKTCQPLGTENGESVYLQRKADEGVPAYKLVLPLDNERVTVPQYSSRLPSGSRADVRAKGRWKNGFWTIEFSRLLDTGHKDDLPFSPDRTYLFGISRFEVSGREPISDLSQPYGLGDVRDHLVLKFKTATGKK